MINTIGRNNDIYIIPSFLFFVLVLGDTGVFIRPLLTFVFPVLLFFRYIILGKQNKAYVQKRNINLNILVFLYLLWMLLTTLSSDNIVNSLYFFMKQLIFFILIYIVFLWLDSTQKYMAVLKSCFYAALFISCYVITEYVLAEIGIIKLDNYRIAGMYSNVNSGGFVVAMLAISCYMEYLLLKKKKYLYVMVLCVFSVLLTGSRAALLIFLMPLLLFVGKMNLKKKTCLLFFFIILLFFIFPYIDFDSINNFLRVENGTAGRVYLWQLAVDLIEDNLFLGIGVGNLKEQATVYIDRLSFISLYERDALIDNAIQSSHNMYLEAFVETGIIGGTIYILILFTVLRHYRKGLKSCFSVKKTISLLFLGMGYGVVLRGFFESNGFLCKGWLNVDVLFWVFLVLFEKSDLIFNTYAENVNNLSSINKSKDRGTSL